MERHWKRPAAWHVKPSSCMWKISWPMEKKFRNRITRFWVLSMCRSQNSIWRVLRRANCARRSIVTVLFSKDKDVFPKQRLIVEFRISDSNADSLRVEIPLQGFNEALAVLKQRTNAR